MRPSAHITTNYLADHGVWLIEVQGIHDITTSGRLGVTLRRFARVGRPIVVDLSRTRFVDASIMQTLSAGRADCELSGTSLRLVLAESRRPAAPADVRPLPAAFHWYATVAQALAPHGGRG